jgi:hypothetical protein
LWISALRFFSLRRSCAATQPISSRHFNHRDDTGPGRELLRSPTDAHLFQQKLLLQLTPRAGWLPFLDLLLNLLYPGPRHVLHGALPFTNVLQKARKHETAQALRLIPHAFQHMLKPSAVLAFMT